MKTVLLTGFDPFGGEKYQSKLWEVAKGLHEKNNWRIQDNKQTSTNCIS